MPTLPSHALKSKQQEGGQGSGEAPWFRWGRCLSAVLEEHLTHKGGCHLLAAQMEDEWRKGRNLLLLWRILLFLCSPPLTANAVTSPF